MTQNIIYKIVQASGITAGELVLVHFWGEDTDRPVANQFMESIAKTGATPMLLQQSRTVNKDIFAVAGNTCFDQRYFDMLSGFDAVLDIFAYQPVVLGYEIETEKLHLYREYMKQLFSAFMKCKRFMQIRIPTKENAAESGLEPENYISRMLKAYDIDYPALRDACQQKTEELSQNSQPVLCTGKDCQLHFDLTGRTWYIDAGDGDLPCGEVYIAPVESNTNGNVYFKKLYLEDCGVFEDVTLSVTHGQISSSDNESVHQFLNELPAESKIICELGFGMNPNITDLCGYTLLDEKMADTFHIAIGANTMFGGQNDASSHIDLVGRGKYELVPNKMIDFLCQRISTCEKQHQFLQKEHRVDEADFEKIKINVYGIFKTILSNAIKKPEQGEGAVRAFFLQRLEQIPANWTASREKAIQYDDAEKMQIEKVKLDVILDIKSAVSNLWEEEK